MAVKDWGILYIKSDFYAGVSTIKKWQHCKSQLSLTKIMMKKYVPNGKVYAILVL